MMSRIVRNKSRVLKSALLAFGILAALLVVSASPAEARARRVVVHPRAHVVVQKVHRPFIAPRHVPFRTVRFYDPFFDTRVFFAPHRHFHAVYRFPVVTSFGIVYQPYSYCGDDLYSTGYVGFGGPQFRAAVRF